MSLAFWILISFVSASVPWSLILGYIFSNRTLGQLEIKIQEEQIYKLSGIKVGLMAIFLDISKSFFPVYFSLFYGFVGYELILICLAAISGSIFSPFLKFNGGKSLIVSCGIWLAISSGIIGPLICLMMAFSHLIQKLIYGQYYLAG